jgi:hypothetical protein
VLGRRGNGEAADCCERNHGSKVENGFHDTTPGRRNALGMLYGQSMLGSALLQPKLFPTCADAKFWLQSSSSLLAQKEQRQ